MRVAALVLLLAPGVARGDSQVARALFAEGKRLYAAGDYAGAAKLFDRAFDEDPDPAYIFNLGQAHRMEKDCAAAAAAYRTFLELVPSAPNVDEVKGYEREMTACSPPPPPRQPAPPKPEPPVAPPAASPRSISIPSLIVNIAGVALISGGVIAGVSAGRRAREREELCLAEDGCVWTAATDAEAASLDRRGKRASNLAVAGFAAGGAALVTGVVLQVLHLRGARRDRLAVVPAGGGFVVQGRF